MKKYLVYGIALATALTMASCNDLLDDNNMPLGTQSDSDAYWNETVNVQAQCDQMYTNYYGYGNTTSWVNNFYYRSLSDNQSAIWQSGSGCVFPKWDYDDAPSSNSIWTSSYQVVRHANYIIERVPESSMDDVDKRNFVGIAKLQRAQQYYELVRAFGDVILVDKVLDNKSEELYAARTDRNVVMDFVLDDINYACENISTQSNAIAWSKDLALATKAEICLYEAAYAKYHQGDNTRANKYYNEVVSACSDLMTRYSICSDYNSIYNSLTAALKANPEVIFMKAYAQGVLCHSMLKYLNSNTTVMGMSKDAFDSYLFLDGKPKGLTTMDTSDKAEAVVDEKGATRYSIATALANRDKRLGMTIDEYLGLNANKPVRYNDAGDAVSDPLTSNTGYLITKFNNASFDYTTNTTDGQNYTAAPLYWISLMYLDYAEAKAELGTINDSDLNATINKLYERAGLPTQTVASLSAIADPANNTGISNLLWEIRRCRRCETMFDLNYRYWDLIRWHWLDRMDTTNYPDCVTGCNLDGIPADQYTGMCVNADGYVDCATNATTGVLNVRAYSDREYLQPLGTTELRLNDNLEQNPGW